jgi:hypothetical protein
MTLLAPGFRISNARALLDNGSDANFMSKTLYDELEGVSASQTRQEFETVDGHLVTALGKATLRVEWEPHRQWLSDPVELEFFIIHNLRTDLLIGANTMREHSLQKIARYVWIPMRNSPIVSLVVKQRKVTPFLGSDEGSDSNPPKGPWPPLIPRHSRESDVALIGIVHFLDIDQLAWRSMRHDDC